MGVLAWKLAESLVIPDSLVAFDRPDITAVPVPPPGPYRDSALADLLRQYASAEGSVGIYAKSLRTGAEGDLNGERTFAAASLYKLPILAEVVRETKTGQINLDQQLVIGREHWVPGSGVLQARIGESLPIRELLRLLIVESDNIAAVRLLDFVGLEAVNQSMQAMGLRSTRLLDWRAPGAYVGAGPYATSPNDMGLLLEVIANGNLIDGGGAEEALRLLERKQAKHWLADGVPQNVRVAHKWGEVPGSRHDAGIVFTPRSQYVLVVMTEGLDTNTSGEYIREVSRAVYAYFDGGR